MSNSSGSRTAEIQYLCAHRMAKTMCIALVELAVPGARGRPSPFCEKVWTQIKTLESALRCILDWNVIVAQICALASPHLSPFALKFTAMSLRSRWASILTLVLKDFIWFALSFPRIYCVFTGAFEIAGSEFHVHAPIASDCCGLASWYSVAEACHDLHHTGQTSRCMASLGSHNFWRTLSEVQS